VTFRSFFGDAGLAPDDTALRERRLEADLYATFNEPVACSSHTLRTDQADVLKFSARTGTARFTQAVRSPSSLATAFDTVSPLPKEPGCWVRVILKSGSVWTAYLATLLCPFIPSQTRTLP